MQTATVRRLPSRRGSARSFGTALRGWCAFRRRLSRTIPTCFTRRTWGRTRPGGCGARSGGGGPRHVLSIPGEALAANRPAPPIDLVAAHDLRVPWLDAIGARPLPGRRQLQGATAVRSRRLRCHRVARGLNAPHPLRRSLAGVEICPGGRRAGLHAEPGWTPGRRYPFWRPAEPRPCLPSPRGGHSVAMPTDMPLPPSPEPPIPTPDPLPQPEPVPPDEPDPIPPPII